MSRGRFTIGRLLVAIAGCATGFAMLRSGSSDWFKLLHTATLVLLVYAAIVARYCGAAWYGFAVAGWAYFVVALGPWIGDPPGSQPLRAVNRNIITSMVLEVVGMTVGREDPPVRSGQFFERDLMARQNRSANRDGICHSALTILFGLAGAAVARWAEARGIGAAVPSRIEVDRERDVGGAAIASGNPVDGGAADLRSDLSP